MTTCSECPRKIEKPLCADCVGWNTANDDPKHTGVLMGFSAAGGAVLMGLVWLLTKVLT